MERPLVPADRLEPATVGRVRRQPTGKRMRVRSEPPHSGGAMPGRRRAALPPRGDRAQIGCHNRAIPVQQPQPRTLLDQRRMRQRWRLGPRVQVLGRPVLASLCSVERRHGAHPVLRRCIAGPTVRCGHLPTPRAMCRYGHRNRAARFYSVSNITNQYCERGIVVASGCNCYEA